MAESFVEPIEPASLRGRFGAQNGAVVAAQTMGWFAMLWALDQPLALPVRLVVLVLFCWTMQGVFSMMHEYFHQNAHRDPRVNYAIGLWCSTLFGTSATLHRVNHWGHHVRNRAEAEQGDFILPGETALRKIALYYFAVCGGLWLSGLLFPLASLVIPYRAVRFLSSDKRLNTYSAAFEQFRPQDWTAMRLEALALFAFWIAVPWLAGWSWTTVAQAYAAFAFSWSSLQWVYHLRTPLHPVEGAYNLRAPLVVRWLFLNFNYNLTHHRRPALAWQELYDASDARETQPLWYRWLAMVQPPVRKPDDLAYLEKVYF